MFIRKIVIGIIVSSFCAISIGCTGGSDWSFFEKNKGKKTSKANNQSDYIDSLSIIECNDYQLSEKRIYILDVTRSMIGKGSGKTYDILEKCKGQSNSNNIKHQ